MFVVAWFQASSRAGFANNASNLGQIQVADPQYSATSAGLPIKVKVSRGGTNSSANLKLVTYLAADEFAGKKAEDGTTDLTGDPGLYEAYYRSAQKTSIVYKAASAGTSSLENFAVYTIGVYVDFPDASDVTKISTTATNEDYWKDNSTVYWRDSNGGDWTESEVKTQLSSTERFVQYGIVRTTRNVTIGETPTDVASRAKFFSADSDGTVPTTAADGAESVTASADTKVALSTGASTAGIDNIGEAAEANPYVIGSFGLYIEGSEEVDNAIDNLENGRVIHGDFTVNVTKGA